MSRRLVVQNIRAAHIVGGKVKMGTPKRRKRTTKRNAKPKGHHRQSKPKPKMRRNRGPKRDANGRFLKKSKAKRSRSR